MKFIKENLVLSMGILLPVLLMAVFFISVHLPKAMEPAPSYDFFVSLKSYNYDNSLDYSMSYKVENKHIVVKVDPLDEDEKKRRNIYTSTLYKYDASSQQLIEITPVVTLTELGTYTVQFDGMNTQINTGKTAPDGYIFGTSYDRHGRGLFGDIFGYRSRDHSFILSKGSTRHKIAPPTHHRYWYGSHNFLGWVIKE